MNEAAIDALLAQAVETAAATGVVAIAATAQATLYKGACGLAGVNTRAKMSPDTVMWLMSLTKGFTSVACLQLLEAGAIHIDQNAGEILPELATSRVLEGFTRAGEPIIRPARRPITLRHLLTHTSGYAYSIWNKQLAEYLERTGTPDIGSCLNAAFAAPLVFDPGECWEYGMSTDWIGKIVETISGQSLETYLRMNIFEPLGMTDTGFILGPSQRARLAGVFARQADGSLEPLDFALPQDPEFFMGGGGAFGTPRDCMRFLRALLNGGELDKARILRPETAALLFSNQIGASHVRAMRTTAPAHSNDFDLFPGMLHKWSLAFDINSEPGRFGRSAGSASWAGLLNCHFWIDPAAKITGALFTQTLPFFDLRIMALYGAFEREIYRSLAHVHA